MKNAIFDRSLPTHWVEPVQQPKTVEQLQSEFIAAVARLDAIHQELTRAMWLRDYDKAPG